MKDAAQLLRNGIEAIELSCTDKQIDLFLTYLEELKKWNKAYNLTGLKTDREIIIKHFLDSLLFSKVLPGDVQSMADVGSGAGFPGIPMKIIDPKLNMFLIEPSKKKAMFLKHICKQLRLENVEVIDSRIEAVKNLKVDVAVTRALHSVSDFVKKAGSIVNEKGVLILSKGPKLAEEMQNMSLGKIAITDLKLPFLDIVRHLVVIRI